MRAQLDAQLCGSKHTLALPMGALEDVAEKVDEHVYELAARMANGRWKLSEVVGVLDNALVAGGSDLSAEDVIHNDGLMRAAEVAYLILERALTGNPSKKAKAVAKAKSPKPDS